MAPLETSPEASPDEGVDLTPVTLTISYVDDEKGGVAIGQPVTMTGIAGDSGTYTLKAPNNYQMADGQASQVPYAFAAGEDVSDDLVIHLTHRHFTDQMGIGRYVFYLDEQKNKLSVNTQSMTWDVDKDLVTGITTYTPNGGFAAVPTPEMAGFKPNRDIVPAISFEVTTEAPPFIYYSTVIYHPDIASLKVTYVDDEKSGEIVGTPETLSGTTGEARSYTAAVPENYKLAAGQEEKVDYTFASGEDDSDDFVIHLVHDHATASLTTVWQIRYTGAGEATPPDVSQNVLWTADTDKVAATTNYTPETIYKEVIPPKVPGYIAVPRVVTASGLTTTTEKPTDSVVTVNYISSQQKGAVVYYDETEKRQLKIDYLRGDSFGTSDYQTASTIADFVAKGYVLVSDGYPKGDAVFDGDVGRPQVFTVSLKHGFVAKAETKTVTETISYLFEDGTKAAEKVTQKVIFTRTVMLDKVTSAKHYTAWKPVSGHFDAVKSPVIKGYTASRRVVPQAAADFDSEDIQIKVFYRKNSEAGVPGKPVTTEPHGELPGETEEPEGEPNEPGETEETSEPDKPEEAVQIIHTPQREKATETPQKTAAETPQKSQQEPAVKGKEKTTKADPLPKTGEDSTQALSVLGVLMAAFAGAVLGKRRNRKEE